MTPLAVISSCLIATAAAMNIPDSLRDVVKVETHRIPDLRQKEMERKNVMERQLAGMAVRKLDQSNYGNYNNYDPYASASYNWDEYMDEYGLGFDITNYAIKYTQCSTVQTYSDELAQDEDSDTVLAAKRFAIFRLCPADQCSDYSSNGCGSNYGEYIVSLDQFLMAMLEYQESRVSGYCEYCQGCAAIESAKSFWTLVYNTRDYALGVAKTSYTNWYTAFLENYAYNNGNNANEGNYDSNMLAQQYYQQIRNGSNYANQYAQNNYQYNSNNNKNSNNGNSNYSSGNGSSNNGNSNSGNYMGYSNGQGYGYNAENGQYRWSNQAMWQYQSSRQYNNQQSWANMGSPSGTFYGRQIMNGYYDGSGAFNQIYGYFNTQGEYISLEDEEIYWDEDLWGEKPELWDGVTMNTEPCSYQYSGSCYNQYDACMQILEDQEYQEYQAFQEYQSSGGYMTQEQMEENMRRATLKDFMQCVEVNPQAAYGGSNDYANYQYAQKNGSSQYSQTNQNQNQYQYDCGGNEYCEKMQQYKQNQYQYQQQMYQNQNNRPNFIGPHCGSDGKSITLAVYKDEYCSVVDDSKTVEDVLGYALSSNIDLFPSECMNCMDDGQSQPWYEDEVVYALEPMCSMLYQFAGKCNKHLEATEYETEKQSSNQNNADTDDAYAAAVAGDDAAGRKLDEEEWVEEEVIDDDEDWKQMYQSENQAQNEDAVCSFIESLVSNTYNEKGEVTLSGGQWSTSAAEFLAESRAMNAGLKAALCITALATLAMAVAACFIHNTLARKNIPWKPRRSKGTDPTEMARQNSGITMGRSRSGPGNNPLL